MKKLRIKIAIEQKFSFSFNINDVKNSDFEFYKNTPKITYFEGNYKLNTEEDSMLYEDEEEELEK